LRRLFIFALLAGFILGCHPRADRSHFEQGQKLWDQGYYLEAIKTFEVLVMEHPDSKYADDALHMIGSTYQYYLKQWDRALSSYQRLIKDYPESSYAPSDQLRIAEIYHYQLEDFPHAIVEYHRLLSLFKNWPDRDRILYRLALCFFELSDYRQVRTTLDLLLRDFPESDWVDEAMFWKAESYYIEGEQEKALKGFRDYLERYPDGELSLSARFGVAKSLEESDNLLEAIAAYEEILPLYPNRTLIEKRIKVVKKRYQEKKR